MRTDWRWRLSAAAAGAAVLAVTGCSSSGGQQAGGSGGSPADGSTSASPPAASSSAGATGSASPVPARRTTWPRPHSACRVTRRTPTASQQAALRAQHQVIAHMSAQQMAGQRVIYSYTGLTAPGWLLTDIRRGLVGGVIFFSFNISSEPQISGVIRQLAAANASAGNPARKFPLLLMTDQEGGAVRRLPGGPAESEAQIGASADPEAAAAAQAPARRRTCAAWA